MGKRGNDMYLYMWEKSIKVDRTQPWWLCHVRLSGKTAAVLYTNFSGNLNQIKRNRKSGLETTRKRRCLRWPTCVWLRSGVAVSSTSMTLSISSGVENVATRFCQLLVLTLSWLFQASTSLVCLYGQYTNTVKMMMMIKDCLFSTLITWSQ